VNLFCDTSVLLAAAKSSEGASRALFDYAPETGWTLLASPWVNGETVHNLDKFESDVRKAWQRLEPKLSLVADVVSLDRALVFPVPKDRPVLITALAWADVLLTLDRADFINLLGSSCYGMPIMTPSDFLERERAAGRLHS
jgi:predicted nucleic acid-binding protein